MAEKIGIVGRKVLMERRYALEEIQAIAYPILKNHGVSRAYLLALMPEERPQGRAISTCESMPGKSKGCLRSEPYIMI